jgi:hypothetical protein
LQLSDSPSKNIYASLQLSIQRRVWAVRRELTAKQLDGCKVDDSFGALSTFCILNHWRDLVHDPADSYHLRLFDFVVFGDVTAEHDVVQINISSPWMLTNLLCAITAGFQLNANVTGNFCRASVDLVEFQVNSIPCQNNVLCLSLILKGTLSETVYQLTWDDLRAATILLCSVEQCCDRTVCVALSSRN